MDGRAATPLMYRNRGMRQRVAGRAATPRKPSTHQPQKNRTPVARPARESFKTDARNAYKGGASPQRTSPKERGMRWPTELHRSPPCTNRKKSSTVAPALRKQIDGRAATPLMYRNRSMRQRVAGRAATPRKPSTRQPQKNRTPVARPARGTPIRVWAGEPTTHRSMRQRANRKTTPRSDPFPVGQPSGATNRY